MCKQFSVLIFVIVFSLQSFSQKVILSVSMENKVSSPANDTIYYNTSQPLAWDDFKGAPDLNNPAGAITASGFAFHANMKMENNNVYLNIGIYTFFSKKNSWRKPNIN